MPGAPKDKSIRRVNALADELKAGHSSHHAAELLEIVRSAENEECARAAVQALKLHYIAAFDDEAAAAAAKRARPAADGAGGDAPTTATAAAAAAGPRLPKQVADDYAAYVAALVNALNGSRPAPLQVAALAALMECARHEAGPGAISGRLVGVVVDALTRGGGGGGGRGAGPEAFALLFSRYLPLADVRYHALKAAARAAERMAAANSNGSSGNDAAAAAPPSAGAVRALFDIVAHVAPLAPDAAPSSLPSWCGAAEAGLVAAAADAAESAKARRKRKARLAAANGDGGGNSGGAKTAAAWANAKAQQRAYGDAWLALLRLDLPPDIHRKALIKLHTDVIGAVTDPALFADFLTASLDRGGLDGMLALNGIFLLVTRHGLEYPRFYARLYNLLTAEAFASRHRAQFFRLADIFLSSGLVPAYTAAAFAKRFARLALRAPPAGAMVAVAFAHNLIRRHPSCMVLLHRPSRPGGGGGAQQQQQQQQQPNGDTDPYDERQPDPALSRAIESSLWELEALRAHYCPQVAALTAVLDKDLSDRSKTAEVDLDPLLSASYSSLASAELARRLKSAPFAFYPPPGPRALFGGGGSGGSGGGGEGEDARASEVQAAAAMGNSALLAALPGWDLGALPPAAPASS